MSDSEAAKITGVLLLGGDSLRFGSPKAVANLAGKTFAERGWETLAWCDERLAVGKNADRLGLPFEVHDDQSSVRAPIAGVVAGIRLAANDLVVFLPVDCPLMTSAGLQQLAAACEDAAVPPTGPLPGAYHRRSLPLLEQRLADGDLALRRALDSLAVRIVPLDPDQLANVNTREDLEKLETLVGGAQPS